MGQRHQLYYKVPEESSSKIIAFHHQWLYGTLPLLRMKWILQYENEAEAEYSLRKNTLFFEKEALLQNLITTNASHGTHSPTHNITEEVTETKGKYKGCLNPGYGDNNDGITIMDFTQKKIAYAFIHICDCCDYKNIALPLQPLTAEQYLLTYYQKTDPKWKAWKMDALIRYIHKRARLLTVEELHEMFPSFYAEVWEERRKLKKTLKTYRFFWETLNSVSMKFMPHQF